MAKITTTGFEDLIVTEEKAKDIFDFREEKRAAEKAGGMTLNMFPITIMTTDGRLWSGNLSQIGPILMNETTKVFKHNFKSEEHLKEFHQKHGYGGNQDIYQHGYGLLDVKTQFLIATQQARIEDGKLVMIPNDKKEYWENIWGQYLLRLDVFNDLEEI